MTNAGCAGIAISPQAIFLIRQILISLSSGTDI
jgi:hypothetical protein